MKRWLRRKINNFLRDSDAVEGSLVKASPSNDIESDNAFNLTVMNANGGTVVKAYKYDRRTDRSHNTLYIIRSEDDMAEQVARIITAESLK